MSLQGKKIILALSGGIAAYKTPLLLRLLVKEGAEVQVIMTENAKAFVSPLVLSTLSKKEVLSASFSAEDGTWNNHVELGLWADLFVVAPCTANTLSKMANGICDSLLLAVYLSLRCPCFVFPAMDLDMFAHPSTQRNIKTLKEDGNQVFMPDSGELASGLIGQGRLPEPEKILQHIQDFFVQSNSLLAGKRVLVTTGPTQEAIDPVRYISNRSTGLMGFEIAKAFEKKGADVYLVAGPNQLSMSEFKGKVIKVESADDMWQACDKLFALMDVCVFTAAVADYRVKEIADKKIKKKGEELTLQLIKNVDIALEFGKLKKDWQISVGFALETDNELFNAKEKLKKKNFDMVVLNSLQDAGAGFAHATNKVTLIGHQEQKALPLKNKSEVAQDIVIFVEELLEKL